MVNDALARFDISFSATASLYENDFLFERFVLPFCRPYDIGNGACDPLCNVSLTGYDGGECGAYIPPANCTYPLPPLPSPCFALPTSLRSFFFCFVFFWVCLHIFVIFYSFLWFELQIQLMEYVMKHAIFWNIIGITGIVVRKKTQHRVVGIQIAPWKCG